MKAARMAGTERVFQGNYHAARDRMLNAAGTKGGVRHDSAQRCGTALFSYLFHSAAFAFYSSDSVVPIQENRGGRERPPPKSGGSCGPDSGAVRHASIRPHGGRSRPLL